jgi:hypothetical protein
VLRKDDIEFVKETVALHVPVLSLYVDINPALPENAGGAWFARVKDAIKALPAPRDLAAEVIAKLDLERPQTRTYVLFASKHLMKTYELHVDLPLVDLTRGRVDARWGEPYMFPLLYVLDESEHHGVLFIDQWKWRLFEVFLGEIEEISKAFLDLSNEEPPPIPRPAQRFVEGVTLRGGAIGDRFARHVEAHEQRFYKRAAQALEKLIDAHHIGQLILMGPHEDTHLFEQYLPRRIRALAASHVSSLPNPGASAGEVLKKVDPIIEENVGARELALLREVRDRGRWTVPTVLQDLQMSRLHLLIAPWKLEVVVWRCASGLVAWDRAAIDAFCPGQQTKQSELRDVLPELAVAHGARLELVRGKAEAQLLGEFGGLAGLPRW